MKFSLKTMTITMISVIIITMGIISVMIMNYSLNKDVTDMYSLYIDHACKLAANLIDKEDLVKLREDVKSVYYVAEGKVHSDEWGSPEFDAYVANYVWIYDTPEYESVITSLRKVTESLEIDSVYINWINLDEQNQDILYLADAASEDACPIGCVDPFFYSYEDEVRFINTGFPVSVSKTEQYGKIMTAASPIFGEDGEPIAHLGIDVPVQMMYDIQNSYAGALVGALAVISVLMIILSVLGVNRFIVNPIRKLSDASGRLVEESGKKSSGVFTTMPVSGSSEIRKLTEAMQQMEKDLNDHIDNLVIARERLMETEDALEDTKKLVTKDGLTGLRNKLSYDQDTVQYEKDIAEGDYDIGIAMIDMNYLKKINDTYGHDKGNIALKKLTEVICDVFMHSPVYRVGGDEFVVVLRGRDYARVDLLVDEFETRIAILSRKDSEDPWLCVSAAIGYSLFNPVSDRTLGDVFEKADTNMYAKKKMMKASRED